MEDVDNGKPVQVLVPMGTVPQVVVDKPECLAQYARDTYGLDLSRATIEEATFSEGVPSQTVVVAHCLQTCEAIPVFKDLHVGTASSRVDTATAGAAAAAAAAGGERNDDAEGLNEAEGSADAFNADDKKRTQQHDHTKARQKIDSLKAIADLCRLCQHQAKQISLLEGKVQADEKSMTEQGPRAALIAERGRNLLLAAELEDVKQRLRQSEQTVQEFAFTIGQLKSDVRQLVELHSVGDYASSV